MWKAGKRKKRGTERLEGRRPGAAGQAGNAGAAGGVLGRVGVVLGRERD